MSGHSKWSTIKRKKEKTDNARAKVFTKIGRVASHHKAIVKCSLLVIECNLMVIDDSKKSRICHLLDTDISTLNLFAAGIERENGNKTDCNYR